MSGLLARLGRLPQSVLAALVAGLFLAVWAGDRATGADVGFFVFYLVPVILTALLLGKTWIAPAALAGALLWLEAELHEKLAYSHASVPYLNAVQRAAGFLLVGYTLWRLRDAVRIERENSKLKSEMVSLVSHEFNNVLTPIWMAAAVLRETEPSPSTPKRARCYELLARNCDHLKRTAHTFLSLGRLQSGHFQLSLTCAPIRPLVQKALEPMSLMVEDKKLTFRYEFPEEVIPVRVDPDALHLVLSNLLVNAIKYTPEGGEIAVRIRPEGRQVVVEVQDTGVGIPAEDQPKVLEGHFRSEAGKRAAKGHGVGLKVSRDILESHGSRLELWSEPGKGSTFHFRLDIDPPR